MDKIAFLEKIQVRDLSFSYRKGEPVLSGASLSIRTGEFVSIVGPSGCGKSTLLSLLAGLHFPQTGSVLLDGKPVTGPGTDRAVVFQHYSLFPWMTAKNNIAFALRQVRRSASKREARETAERYLNLVGLEEAGDRYPTHLSGGMQQRVAIARAFALDAQTLLMDEPFSAVDTKNRVALQNLLLRLCESGTERKTVVFVTHDIDEAILLSDRIVVMSARTGSVREQIPVHFERPRMRSLVMKTAEYAQVRNRIVDLFHEDEEALAEDDAALPADPAVNG